MLELLVPVRNEIDRITDHTNSEKIDDPIQNGYGKPSRMMKEFERKY